MHDKPFSLGPVTYSQEWYNLRSLEPRRQPPFVLGASDAGVIYGVSKWKTALELFYEIRGYRPPREETEAMRLGKRLEAAVLEEYGSRTGVQVQRPAHMYVSTEEPLLAATLDGEGVDEHGPFCVEAKCTNWRMYQPGVADYFGDEPDEVPRDYLLQAQQQMFVTGYERCDIVVLFDAHTVRIYPQHRNEVVIQRLLERARRFAQAVLQNQPPTPDWEHETTKDLVRGLYGVTPGIRLTFPAEECALFETWQEAKREIARQEAIRDLALAKLTYAMGDAELAEVPSCGCELRRTYISEQLWTEKDLQKAQEMLGQVKKRGYVRITERVAK